MRVFAVLALPPFRQVGDAGHVIGDDRLVEVVEVLVADGLRDLPGATGVLGRLVQDVAVSGQKIVIAEPLLDVPLDKALPDQEVAGLHGVDAPPLHGAVRDDRQTVQQHLRRGDGGAARTRPVRLRIRGAGQLPGQPTPGRWRRCPSPTGGSSPPVPCSSPTAGWIWPRPRPGTMRNECLVRPDSRSSPSSEPA